MMKRSCEMYDTHGCVADNRTFCMISLLSVDCREVGRYGEVGVGRVIGLGNELWLRIAEKLGVVRRGEEKKTLLPN